MDALHSIKACMVFQSVSTLHTQHQRSYTSITLPLNVPVHVKQSAKSTDPELLSAQSMFSWCGLFTESRVADRCTTKTKTRNIKHGTSINIILSSLILGLYKRTLYWNIYNMFPFICLFAEFTELLNYKKRFPPKIVLWMYANCYAFH